MIRPLQPHRYKPSLLSFPACVQPRLSGGQRVIYQNGRFQDLEEDKSHHEILQPLSAMFADHVILDGMLIPSPAGLTFHVFDVVDYRKSFRQRMDPVAQVLHDTKHFHSIRAVPSRRIKTIEEADLAYKAAQPPYGVIYRIDPCLYLNDQTTKRNRSWQLLERKRK